MVACEAIARDLADAIAEERIELHYQPQIDLGTGEVVAAEALSRWTHEEWGPVPPSQFVAVAEETGSVHALGHLAVSGCCRFGRAWRDRGRPLEVAVNVSPLQLERDGFFEELERDLAESGMAPENLILEVTESEQIADYEKVAARLDIFQGWGVTVSIDDFGTGHSSLSRAIALHAGELKIDRSIIASGDHDVIVDAVQSAHRAGMRVVAEGIETHRQLTLVQDAGCDRAQGYFIARPTPRSEFDHWMSTH
jgi:EAL domain-containing protein (putative c-di-GMP-specific phosphodiesterase class I)